MLIGVIIDDAMLRHLPDYKDKKDITALDRSKVAVQQLKTYEAQALEWGERAAAQANYDRASVRIVHIL